MNHKIAQYRYKYPVIDAETTGNYIRERCKQKSISAKTLADELNISQQAVYKWFHGECVCDIDHLIALSCMLGEPVDELIKLKQK